MGPEHWAYDHELARQTARAEAEEDARDRQDECESGIAPANFTDLGNAQRLVKLQEKNLLHCPAIGDLIWNGTHYERDELKRAMQLAIQSVRQLHVEAFREDDSTIRERLSNHANKSESEQKLRAMLAIARTDPRVAVAQEQLDKHAHLLNTPTGTVDLRTGACKPHNQDDLLTRCTTARFDAEATAPHFLQFLNEIFNEDAELIAFVQRMIGYGATGYTSEQVLFFWYGTGANGKSVLAGAVQDALGLSYTMTTAPGLLLKRGDSHTTGLADLRGQRLVFSQEIDEGGKLAEGLVKQVTGSDRMRARWMYRDNFEWEPTHKINLVANHRPEIRGTDHAIWRRILLIPFLIQIPEEKRDRQLREKLREEGPGILNWIVEGAKQWYEQGLNPPDSVLAATSEYRSESDPLSDFIEEGCVLLESAQVRAGDLLEAFQKWAKREGRAELDAKGLKARLHDRGIQHKKTNRARMYLGIGLLSNPEQ